jgi:hypothetical protein
MATCWISVLNSSPVQERRNAVLCCERFILVDNASVVSCNNSIPWCCYLKKSLEDGFPPAGLQVVLTYVHKTIVSQVVCGLNGMRQTALITACYEHRGDFVMQWYVCYCLGGAFPWLTYFTNICHFWILVHLYRYCIVVLYWPTVGKCVASQSNHPCSRNTTVIPFSWLI